MSLIKRIEELGQLIEQKIEHALQIDKAIAGAKRELTALHQGLEDEEKKLLSPRVLKIISPNESSESAKASEPDGASV